MLCTSLLLVSSLLTSRPGAVQAAPLPPLGAPNRQKQETEFARSGGRTLGALRFGDRAAELGSATEIEERFGGRLFSMGDPLLKVAPTAWKGIFHLTFTNTGTGWQEPVLFGAPAVPLSPAPVLVLFHGFGVSEYDCLDNTGLMKRAMDRGWYVVAPRGAHDVNFAIPYAQANIEYVLDWVLNLFDVDPSRTYAVGFSMGGGGAMSYGARHLDPTHARFAAIVNHTGTVSVSHAYYNESPETVDILEDPLMFGGSPTEFPFAYQQASVIDLSATQETVDPTSDLARNLTHVPVQTWSATLDPISYLLTQCDAVHAWLTWLGGSSERIEVASNKHSWSTLNEFAVLDFLEQHTLGVPREGTHRVLADREGRFLHFHVEQDMAGAFTPFRWNMNSTVNRLVIDATENMRRLTVDTSSLGLDPSAVLRVVLGTQDGSHEEIRLDGYPVPPSAVLRNGQSSPNWSHDPVSATVTLFEADAAGYPLWLIQP